MKATPRLVTRDFNLEVALAEPAGPQHTHVQVHPQWPVLKCSVVAALDCSVTARAAAAA